jgi:hypothetical protein
MKQVKPALSAGLELVPRGHKIVPVTRARHDCSVLKCMFV